MLEAVKQNGLALARASVALKDDREIVLAAVKQNGRFALAHASPNLCNGGLQSYLQHVKKNILNVEKQSFVATILFGAKTTPGAHPLNDASQVRLCDNSKCTLSLLQSSVRLPPSLSLQTKQLIWKFAGVRSGREWNMVNAAGKKLCLW